MISGKQVNINIKYDGYITRQLKTGGNSSRKLESKKIPEDMDYDQVKSLRIEAVQKLKTVPPGKHRPGLPYRRGISGGCIGAAGISGKSSRVK
jgi:tRNA U34 5-carboxymethylaminomethyl modifying enzyme MnmG/GidA